MYMYSSRISSELLTLFIIDIAYCVPRAICAGSRGAGCGCEIKKPSGVLRVCREVESLY